MNKKEILIAQTADGQEKLYAVGFQDNQPDFIHLLVTIKPQHNDAPPVLLQNLLRFDDPDTWVFTLNDANEIAKQLGGIEPKTKKKADKPTDLNNRRDYLRSIHEDQLALFVETFPERILHPQIDYLISLLPEYENAREIDITRLAERAERITSGGDYWDGLSDVHVSRLWHQDGVALAAENKITQMQIIAKLDDRTCDVCMVMHGNIVNVDQAAAKFDQDMEIQDPDEYADSWAFPRFNEVQLLSADDITSAGYMPPFHPGHKGQDGCRCTMRFLAGDE